MSAAPGLLRQELSCPLCLQLFDGPVTAECGHSFCRACLGRAAGEPGPDGTAPCPCCQAPTRPQALSTNLQLARLVEGLAQVPQGHCEEHLDPLSVYCEQDRALVCGVCASLGAHRGHRLLPAAEAHARLKVWDAGGLRGVGSWGAVGRVGFTGGRCIDSGPGLRPEAPGGAGDAGGAGGSGRRGRPEPAAGAGEGSSAGAQRGPAAGAART